MIDLNKAHLVFRRCGNGVLQSEWRRSDWRKSSARKLDDGP